MPRQRMPEKLRRRETRAESTDGRLEAILLSAKETAQYGHCAVGNMLTVFEAKLDALHLPPNARSYAQDALIDALFSGGDEG